MSDIGSLNTTDASNTDRFPENMPPSAVNDGARALEGMLARGFKDAVEGNLTSGGSSNDYTLTPNRTISAYYTGLRFQFKASFANTGAATLNVSSIGQKNVYKPTLSGLTALGGGEIQSNQIVDVYYDGTQFVLLSALPLPAATQAEQESGSATDKAVTSGRQQYHPSAAKAWVSFDASGGSPSISDSYNVSSITDVGVGLFDINFTTNFADTNYAGVGGGRANGTSNAASVLVQNTDRTKSAGTFPTLARATNLGTGTVDADAMAIAFYGDQ